MTLLKCYRSMILNNKFLPYFDIFKRGILTTFKKNIKVKVDGIAINYEACGPEEGKVALFLPGTMGSIERNFAVQLKELGSKGIRAIFWDPPGYGKSIPPNRDFSSNYFSNDAKMAALLMKALGYDKYSLAGWSDGGITALYMALNHPNHIEKLIVWGANAFVGEQDFEILKRLADIGTWSDRMLAPAIAEYGGRDYLEKTMSGQVEGMAHVLAENGGSLYPKPLSAVSCPTLVVHGAKDELLGEEHARILEESIPHVELVIWENGKHALHLKYAEEFNDLVVQFLNR